MRVLTPRITAKSSIAQCSLQVCNQRNLHCGTFYYFCRDPVTKSTPTWEYDQAELKKLLSKMGLVSLPHACFG